MKYTRKIKPRKLDNQRFYTQKPDKPQQQKMKGGANPWLDGP